MLLCGSLKDLGDTGLEHHPIVLNITVSIIGQGASGSQTFISAYLSGTEKAHTKCLLNEWLHLKQTASLKKKACPERDERNSES